MIITTIGEILGARAVHSAAPGDTVRDAAEKMRAEGVGALAVIADDTLAGVISERDLVFRCVAPGKSPDTTLVSDIMTPDPVTVDVTDAISDALALKLGNRFRHLPVLDGDRPVGLLSYRDIPAEYLAMFERFREMVSARADKGA